MKKLLVAALMVVLASPAFAAIQNVKVSGDITSTFVDRQDFDLGMVGGTANAEGLKSQDVFITQTRLRVDADLSDNVSASVGLINERAWNAENSTDPNSNYANDTDVQLYLANVTMRELLYSPLTVTVGRQVFTYGNGFILGNGLPNQSSGNLQYVAQDLTERTAEDGVRAVLDYKPLTIDLLYFKNAETGTGLSGLKNANGQSSDVYGINANYQLNDPMSTVVETYLFSRIDGNGISEPLGGIGGGGALTPPNNKGNTLYVPGLRASTNPIKGLNVQGEVAWQLGQEVNGFGGVQEAEHRDAFGAQFMTSYTLPVLDKYKPTVNASYTYVSGDKNAGVNETSPNAGKLGKTFGAWDPMFEGQGAGTVWNTLFPLTNMNILTAGASVNPLEDVTVAATWSDLWAAESFNPNNPLYILQPNNGATPLYPNSKAGDRGLGNELDLNLTYNYTEDVTFGVNAGWFVPGSAFKAVTTSTGTANKDNASQILASVGVKF